MSETPAYGIVLAHGDLAHGLVDAVREITGAGPDVLSALSNRGIAPATLAAEIRSRVTGGRTFLFTDLPSGSCGFAARMLQREAEGLVVISGVNLPVLLEFVVSRDQPTEALTQRLLSRGRAAMGCTPASPSGNADRIASRG